LWKRARIFGKRWLCMIQLMPGRNRQLAKSNLQRFSDYHDKINLRILPIAN
jgi:hypothetical protein